MDSKQKRYLMCRPNFFKVSYSINPWMKIQDHVNVDLAMEQWNNLKATIESCGAIVDVMEPNAMQQHEANSFTDEDEIDKITADQNLQTEYQDQVGQAYVAVQYYTTSRWQIKDDMSNNASPGDRCSDSGEKIDIVFTANAAIIRGKKAYIANFRYPERKGERFFYEKWFKDNGYETVGNKDVICEGAGDAVWLGNDKRILFVGVGLRTEDRALPDIAQKLADGTNFKVFGCRLVDPRFYHLDVCLTILDECNGFYFPDAFDQITRHNMNNELNLIPVTEQEACNFACNSVVIDKTVIMAEGNDSMKEKLKKLGYETKFVNMSEFLKSGGSARCCTLEI